MYPSLVDDNFWFKQWKERVKTSTICSVWGVHVWDVAKEKCVYVCRMSMDRKDGGYLDADTYW